MLTGGPEEMLRARRLVPSKYILMSSKGPFDLLLALIGKHKLDITEIASSTVTDEFISYISALADQWDLDQASYFLVVAATLLDLKAARLLPSGEVDDEEDLALLEARDLLFARLLQYRAYKEVAAVLSGAAGRAKPPVSAAGADGAQVRRIASRGAARLGPEQFAAIAAAVLAPRKPPVVSTAHLHMPRTTVKEQAGILAVKLRDCRPGVVPRAVGRLRGHLRGRGQVPCRARAVRDKCVGFEQEAPLGDLYISWSAERRHLSRDGTSDDGRMNEESRGRCRVPGRRCSNCRTEARSRWLTLSRAWRLSSWSPTSLCPRRCWPKCSNCRRDTIATALHGLAELYTSQGRGFDLREVAGGWRYLHQV